MSKLNNKEISEAIIDIAVFQLEHYSHPAPFSIDSDLLESDQVKNFFAVAKEHGYQVLSETDEKGSTKLTLQR